MRITTLLFALLTVPLSQACSSAADTVKSGPTVAANVSGTVTSAAAMQQIQAAIGTAACSTQSQCHAIAVGAKACGGPERYLPWSSAALSASTLQPLTDRYAAARRAEIAAHHEISTCSMVLPPAAQCSAAGQCVLQSGAQGGVAGPT